MSFFFTTSCSFTSLALTVAAWAASRPSWREINTWDPIAFASSIIHQLLWLKHWFSFFLFSGFIPPATNAHSHTSILVTVLVRDLHTFPSCDWWLWGIIDSDGPKKGVKKSKRGDDCDGNNDRLGELVLLPYLVLQRIFTDLNALMSLSYCWIKNWITIKHYLEKKSIHMTPLCIKNNISKHKFKVIHE